MTDAADSSRPIPAEPSPAARPPPGGEADSAPPDELRHLRHELRSPLNHIIGYTDLLLEEADDRGLGPLVPGLEAVRADGGEALRLVRDLLEPARLAADPPAAGSLCDALGTVLGQLLDRTAGLAGQANALGADDAVVDLERVDAAARQLLALLAAGLPLPTSMQGYQAAVLTAPPVPTAPESTPLSATTAGGPAPPAPAEQETPAPATILVVDDSTLNRSLLARRLERLGYSVVGAENGRAALAMLAAQPVDLVLLDVMMPEMDGYEVLAHRQADPALRDVPVIMISALDEIGSIVRCIELGAEDYLPKPFDPVLLRARVGASLEKKRLRDQEKQLLATIQAQATELAEWNRTLEARVQQQVQEIERIGRLRRFLSPQIAEVITTSGDDRALQSHRREITVVFTDLRGFTAFAGAVEPEELMDVLHEYHAALGELIFTHEGTVEHFAGDGMMVFFNDPLPCDDPPARAVRMAVAMRERARTLAQNWRRRGYRLGFGVGIAVGEATLGRIGFEGRYDYGAIGPVTNLAARLCAEAADGQIVVSDHIYQAVKHLVAVEPLGRMALKGFADPVPAFNVVALRNVRP